jgi:three-Cys-motif partner protein
MDAELYHGREQTYAKHLFLEQYLERVAFHIAYAHDEFVYVDGFSGPWKAIDEGLEDTSFMIAIRKLQYVREALGKVGKAPRMRCLFIEADRSRFVALEEATRDVARLETKALCGDFETLIPDIQQFVGTGFSLIFIDPTGWDGFAMERISPLLNNAKGEVIVNFMYDHINRFLNDTRPEIEASFHRLFGTDQWTFVRSAADREQIVEYYGAQLQQHGAYPFVTCTPILKPLADRPYFYLLYCTRNIRGLIEFRATEQRSLPARQQARDAGKQRHRIAKTGQEELYDASDLGTLSALDHERNKQLTKARERFTAETAPGKQLTYEHLLGKLLVQPFVSEKDVKQLIAEATRRGDLVIDGLTGKQTAPRLHCVLRGRTES